MAFWIDEAGFAVKLLELPLSELAMRPAGFMWLSRGAAKLLGPSEWVLRLLPWLSGVLGLLLSPLLACRLFTAPAPRLLFISILALHPGAINLAKDFKPYAVSLTIHMLLLWLVLRYLDAPRLKALITLLASAALAQFFGQDAVFAYPGLFGIIALDALSKRRWRDLGWIVGAALLTLTMLALQYIFWWSKVAGDQELKLWWIRVFHSFPRPGEARLPWLWDRLQDLVVFCDPRPTLWLSKARGAGSLATWREISAAVWAIMLAFGVATLAVQRRAQLLLLSLTPILCGALLGLSGHWPMGAVRVNLFLLTYLAVLACAGLDVLGSQPRYALAWLPASLMLLIPLFVFEREWGTKKRYLAYETNVVSALYSLRRLAPRADHASLFVADSMIDSFVYYTQVHPRFSEEIGRVLRSSFSVHLGLPRSQLPEDKFFIFADRPASWKRLKAGYHLRPRGPRNGVRIIEATGREKPKKPEVVVPETAPGDQRATPTTG